MAYDPASRITALSDTAQSWGFTYDNLDRLKTADKTATSLIWDYDPTGNRLFEKLNGVQTDYTTDATSNKLTQLGTTSRTYDAVGNLEDNGTLTYSYSGRNRLSQVQGTTAPVVYQYNAFTRIVLILAFIHEGLRENSFQKNFWRTCKQTISNPNLIRL